MEMLAKTYLGTPEASLSADKELCFHTSSGVCYALRRMVRGLISGIEEYKVLSFVSLGQPSEPRHGTTYDLDGASKQPRSVLQIGIMVMESPESNQDPHSLAINLRQCG
ncbi:hypothetical protein MMC10_000914 [Thelotrema lepadinum]|nr:hypothetical protein [Thelotrema lepadinum]